MSVCPEHLPTDLCCCMQSVLLLLKRCDCGSCMCWRCLLLHHEIRALMLRLFGSFVAGQVLEREHASFLLAQFQHSRAQNDVHREHTGKLRASAHRSRYDLDVFQCRMEPRRLATVLQHRNTFSTIKTDLTMPASSNLHSQMRRCTMPYFLCCDRQHPAGFSSARQL